jgi:ABC-2 type transport system permease protein
VKRFLSKYYWVGRINFLSRSTYLADQFISTIFLVLILFVFYQLWKITLSNQPGAIAGGFNLKDMLWYLLGTEFFVLSMPRVHATIGEEVRSGDIALRLNKPFSYVLFHYASCAGESLIRFLSVLATGSVFLLLIVGPPSLSWQALPALAVMFILAHALNFLFSCMIGLLAFWTEDVIGIHLLFDRTKWVLGGMLLPLPLYPAMLQKIMVWLPFRHMLYEPARMMVRFEWSHVATVVLEQAVWTALFSLVCAGLFTFGGKKVSSHGG